MEGERSAAGARSVTALLAALVFVAFLDNFAQFPILAPLAASLGAGPLMAGLILGGYSLTNLLGNLAVGPLLDRRGALGPLAVSLLVSAAVLAAYTLARTPETLLAARLVHGFTAAAIVPAVFMIASGADGSRTLGRMRFLGMTIGMAAIVAPPLSGTFGARHGFALVYLVLAGLFLFAGIATLAGSGRVRRSARTPTAATASETGPRPVPRAEPASPDPETGRGPLPAWLGAGTLVFAVGSVALVLPLGFSADGIEPAARSAGRLLGLFSLAAVGSMALVGRARRGRADEELLALAGRGLLLMSLALALLLAFRSGVPQAAGAFLLGFGFGQAFPTLSAAVGERSPAGRRGTAYALFYAAFSAGALLGPVAAGGAAGIAPHPVAGYLPAIVLTGITGTGLIHSARRDRIRAGTRPGGPGPPAAARPLQEDESEAASP